LFSVLKTI